ncbi:unnamed protein product [Prunus armeniaca]|nr:unnamed protein product [Prunus armeniaca]
MDPEYVVAQELTEKSDVCSYGVLVLEIVTEKDGRDRPSIKQGLRLLYESSDPMYSGFLAAVDDEEYEETEGRGRNRCIGMT